MGWTESVAVGRSGGSLGADADTVVDQLAANAARAANMTHAPIKVAVLAERLGTGAGGTEVYERCLLTALLDDEFRGGDVEIIPVLARSDAMDVLPPSVRSACRILRPGGWALIMVPIHDAPTDEDPSITDPEERDRRFGQNDHVRYYGMDIVDRFEAAGFRTEVLTAADLLPADGRARHGVEVDDVLFVCWANKPGLPR